MSTLRVSLGKHCFLPMSGCASLFHMPNITHQQMVHELPEVLPDL
ncbi:hypothetical protein BIW11_04510 [Tropilaelaps mercedesae]|uniref:Uncharacterized protein n=1 Tax=Tropilaelaps mercedesae TaxID=418985 RepID=A0A1V9X614_9ACAR|nr:hypothetical protein BIW11_04510 [Tropilaelaps mercedesae]